MNTDHAGASVGQWQPLEPPARETVNVERLPFRVRVCKTPADLNQAVAVRHTAYARHLDASVVDLMRQAEKADTALGTTLLLAESKVDGSVLGSMRIQTNVYGPLALEQSVRLPDEMQGHKLAEATRLAIAGDRTGHLVKSMLVKAGYLFCLRNEVQYMLITARSPVDRQYQRLLFRDLYPEQGYIPLAHVFGLPHRVMYFDVFDGEALWSERKHPLLDFMRWTLHPDIDLN
jgi:hypothetical protein